MKSAFFFSMSAVPAVANLPILNGLQLAAATRPRLNAAGFQRVPARLAPQVIGEARVVKLGVSLAQLYGGFDQIRACEVPRSDGQRPARGD